MEPQRHSQAPAAPSPAKPQQAHPSPAADTPESYSKKSTANPAIKWLYISAGGLAVCLLALGFHFIRGGGSTAEPLPKTVTSQVFGFTPYYFIDSKPPKRVHLKPSSARFFGNALSFKVETSGKQTIEITERKLPAKYTAAKLGGKLPVTTPSGTAVVGSTEDNGVGGELITKDKTLILVTSADNIGTTVIKNILTDLEALPAPQ